MCVVIVGDLEGRFKVISTSNFPVSISREMWHIYRPIVVSWRSQ